MKVLLLEDEKSIRDFVRINLKREGWEVIEAATGEEALEIADANTDIE
ncbi:response regulator transcription factor, partial [Mesorhizobium sp. M00.F.Ca.ET.186.01.1.1]